MPGTRKLGKTTDQRKAMLRQQVTDLLDMGRMETTVFRAKEIAPLAEKMITLGKKKDMAAYRQALAFITREDVSSTTTPAAKYATCTSTSTIARCCRSTPRWRTTDRKSTRLNSSHVKRSRMPSSA